MSESIRIRIAKWLAPELVTSLKILDSVVSEEMWLRFRCVDERDAHRAALIRIANSRTKSANATVRRVCDIAEQSLQYREPK